MQHNQRLVPSRFGRLAVLQAEGRGLPVVFLHGNSLNMQSFAGQFGACGGRPVIALDLLGHGQSEKASAPGEAYAIEGHAAAVSDVLRALDVTGAVVVGCSLGGHVALELSGTLAGLRGIMTIGAPPFTRGEAGFQGFGTDKRAALGGQSRLSTQETIDLAEAASGLSCDQHSPWTASVANTDGNARAFLFKGLMAMDGGRQRTLAESCPVPQAAVFGANDGFADFGYIAGVHYRNLWRGKPQYVENGFHAPNLANPAAFNALFQAFLADVQAAQS